MRAATIHSPLAVLVCFTLDPATTDAQEFLAAPAVFDPPACVTDPFLDVDSESDYCPWIQQLALDGIAGACDGANNYCGSSPVTREQLAVFLERAMHGTAAWDAFRIVPGTFSPNITGGHAENVVTPGAWGATISGGGISGSPHRVTDIFGTIGGGSVNRAGDDAGTIDDRAFATVSGGDVNVASGLHSTVGGGGFNVADGDSATVGGGIFNHADGVAATVPGGRQASAALYGQLAHAGGGFDGVAGTAQTSVLVLRNTSSGTTARELFLDGSVQRLAVNSGRTMSFELLVVGRSNAGQSAGYRAEGVIENVSGTTAFVGGTPSLTVIGTDDASWTVAVQADNTNDALAVTVTGGTGDSVRWVAVVRTAEVVF